jgi:hypothetical protein
MVAGPGFDPSIFAFKNPQALTMRQFIRLDSDKSRQSSLSPDEAGFISATFDS